MLHHLPRALRRPTALVLAPALALSLAACGSDDGDDPQGFDAVEISGDYGTSPTFDFSAEVPAGDAEQETLIEGDGAELADGDRVLVNLAVADGFTEDVVVDTFADDLTGFVATVGEEAGEPQVAGDLLAGYVSDQIEAGMTVGTRFAVTVGVPQAFPDYVTAFTTYDVGNADGLVFVADLVGVVAEGADGQAQKPAGWAPRVVEKKGVPTSLDFDGTPEPSGKLRVTTLIEGGGPEVVDGSIAVVDYLGQVYDGAKPFDESFSEDRTLTAVVGADAAPLVNSTLATPVIKGWSEGLVGVTAGSRVLIEIPPKLGYGKAGQGEDIPGNSTLYFLVDVLGTA
ncbi:FKBP-type peptidyl-prolyl cis-trans isomerase [Nocardioides sp. YIM 152588]|uniref:FKBP-type peptidyl-prolyl cis-trans isomerase n=1 Tax=Nocardioides sp. YIM 152588 TaxID=3158259 RepID=UPI0032E50B87